MHTTTLALMASVAMVSATDYNCPGPSLGVHAMCELKAKVNGSCADAEKEILARMTRVNGWTDPHNNGTYAVTSSSEDKVHGTRTTGKAPHYVDKFHIALDTDGDKCKLTMCSRSQTTSVLDYSTNYCDVHNLYCGTQFGCKFVYFNFEADENFGTCLQHDHSACIV